MVTLDTCYCGLGGHTRGAVLTQVPLIHQEFMQTFVRVHVGHAPLRPPPEIIRLHKWLSDEEQFGTAQLAQVL